MTINQTTPPSSALDTLKALVHRNLSMLSYVSDQLGGRIDEDHEDLLEFIDAIEDMNYDALNEHVAIESQWINRYHQRRIAESGYAYDDGSPIVEHFQTSGLTSSFYPRYDGDRDTAYKQHLEHAEQYLRDAIHHEDMIDTLIETDLETLNQAIQQQNMKLVRMKDGTAPTHRQMSFILGAGKEDFLAAVDELERRALRAQNSAWAAERSADLMQKYEAKPDEPLSVVAERMSAEDREEIESLGLILAEDPLD